MRYLVIGAAGHAQEVAWSLVEQRRAAGEPCDLCFFDDALPGGPVASGLGDVVGPIAALADHGQGDDVALVLGVGLPRTKSALVERLAPLGLPWATVIHPRATIGPNVALGEGTFVAAGAIVTVNVRIGRFATVNMHCQVAHDDVLGDFATLHPDTHLSGNVTIGEGCELGTGSVVIPGCTVGAWAVLGAGCVAIRSVPPGRTWVGVPARGALRSAIEHHRRRDARGQAGAAQ
jgi:sugar O-acyltransferase (sialic acid O-acetyltransferase NeuD family)